MVLTVDTMFCFACVVSLVKVPLSLDTCTVNVRVLNGRASIRGYVEEKDTVRLDFEGETRPEDPSHTRVHVQATSFVHDSTKCVNLGLVRTPAFASRRFSFLACPHRLFIP